MWCCVVYDVLLRPCLVTLAKYFKPTDLKIATPFAWQHVAPSEGVNVAHTRCELWLCHAVLSVPVVLDSL